MSHQNAEEVAPTVQIDEDRAFVMWMAWTHTMYAQPLCQNDPYENSIRRTVPTIHETPQQRLQHELAQQRAGVTCWAGPSSKMMTFRTLYDYREHWRKSMSLQNIWLPHVRAAFAGNHMPPLQAPFS